MENPEKNLGRELTPEENEARRGRDFEEVRKQMIKETEEGLASEETPSIEEAVRRMEEE
jgi:hypothetical protein